jgi:hypothetical protein
MAEGVWLQGGYRAESDKKPSSLSDWVHQLHREGGRRPSIEAAGAFREAPLFNDDSKLSDVP